MEKAESLSFPTVIGSGGRRQSLHNEILIDASCYDQSKTALPYYFFDDCFFCYHNVNTPLNLDILVIY
jgi:hypothetical protein